MMYRAKIHVQLKPGHSDPEGEMTAQTLRELEYPVKNVQVSKFYEIFFNANSKEEATAIVEAMCRRLLANPTKDDYRFDLEEIE